MLRLRCCIALMVVTIALGETAAIGVPPSIEAGMYKAQPGESIIVEISVETDRDLTSLNPAISLNPVVGMGSAVITPGSGVAGGFWGGQAATVSNFFNVQQTAGKFNVSLDNAGESSTGGPDVVVAFDVTVPATANAGDNWSIDFITGAPGTTWSQLGSSATETSFSSMSSGMILIVSEFSPCDFDHNFECLVDDLDQLFGVGDLRAGVPTELSDVKFDLNRDEIIDVVDIDQWLESAAGENGFAAPYLIGDTNLDGAVDSADLNALGISWQQEEKVWSNGDFTGEGRVDSSDLNAIGINWQKSIPLAAAQSVPEPSGILLLFLAGLLSVVTRFKNSSDGAVLEHGLQTTVFASER